MYEQIIIIKRCECCGNEVREVFHNKEEAKRFIENNNFGVETGTDTSHRCITEKGR